MSELLGEDKVNVKELNEKDFKRKLRLCHELFGDFVQKAYKDGEI